MPQDIRIDIKPFDELSLGELHACLRLRAEVFVVGQQICCEADPDELDPKCHHALLRLNGELVGTARLLPIDNGRYIKVGRVAVAEQHRGRGHGSSLMRAIQAWIGQVPGRMGVLSAQAHLEQWYAHLGWLRDGGLYMEAGIKHLEMFFPADSTA